MNDQDALLTVKNLNKCFSFKNRFGITETFEAVKPCSFTMQAKQTLSIIGPIGSGKSTLAKMIVGMIEPSGGEIFVGDQKLEFGDYAVRSQMIRMVFQDPASSLNPQQRVGEILDMTLQLNSDWDPQKRQALILKTLKQVGLLAEHADYYPNTLAAGQKQRVAMARAIILQPLIIVADEPLAALDSPIRSQMVNLMLELQEKQDISFIFVTQDIEVMRHISDYVLVMNEGDVVEQGTIQMLLDSPQHPITQKLLKSNM